MSTEVAQCQPTDLARPANGTSLPNVVGTLVTELRQAATAMAADDISLDLTVGQDQNRTHCKFVFRAYRRNTEIFKAEREING